MWSVRILICLSVLSLCACKHEPLVPEVIPPEGGTTIAQECDADSVYFSNQILPLFQSSCALSGCHDAATAEDGIVLDSYSNILGSGELVPFDTDEGDIYELITETDPDKIMPPPSEAPLSQEQIDLIGQWIEQGAPNNGCVNCDYPEVSFSGTVFPLIQNKCEGCHSGTDPEANLSLTNYDEVRFLVDNNYLIEVLNAEPGYVPMPYNGNQLPQCERDMIQQWIDDGAPDN
ncbi:MAG: hypothetical protein HKN79_03435 [Flavobacteriales bacterium]|nr:hypothetical protein [Flavobacteriales bacterium]